MRPAVFLDRDGILNKLVIRKGQAVSPRTLNEFEPLPGVRTSVEALKRAGLLAIVVTNQPDVARGFLPQAELDRMHEHLRSAVGLDAIYTCCHDDGDDCQCRKPRPGLLLRAAQEWGINLSSSFLIGDSWRDIEAGRAANCTTLLIKAAGDQDPEATADFTVSDLAAAVEVILATVRSSGPAPRNCADS